MKNKDKEDPIVVGRLKKSDFLSFMAIMLLGRKSLLELFMIPDYCC